jgi:predicted 3-demethylubiquinone-9 3-methyltransferase (glyoxalase superfamily)
MQKLTPFLWFDNQAEEAANFYVSIFSNKTTPGSAEKESKIINFSRYGEDAAKVSGKPAGTVMIVTFELYGQRFIALNGGPQFNFSPSISFFVNCESLEEINNLWGKLSEGGKIYMDLEKYPFSEKFGWVQDKFGISWQLNLSGRIQKITPFLWYGSQAEEAIHYYTSLFENSKIIKVDRFGAGEMGPEGNVKHAIFSLNGQEFMAMDSNKEPFTLAISLFVNCETQEEVDKFWSKLSEGGKEGQCGWLEDKYGVSWQIVPAALGQLMSGPDPEKSKRVMKALLQMKKLDINGLKRAYEED